MPAFTAEPWTARDIPSQQGKVAVVTGANTGLGRETARELARAGATVELACRDHAKGTEAMADIHAEVPGADLRVQELDLSSLDSVRTAAADLSERYDRIDLLINNAGVMYVNPRRETADGFELQMGTNHLGHFALTGLLLDRVLAAPAGRVVSVSSVAHKIRSRIDFDDLQFTRRYDRVAAYGRSKLANLLFTYRLDRRLRDAGAPAIATAAHPGVAATELVRNLPGPLRLGATLASRLQNSAAVGALGTLRAATDPAAAGGDYFGPAGPGEAVGLPVWVASTGRSHDPEAQDRLWAASEELTGVTFEV
ncbi:oxidoreductase [Nocardioides sp. CFH 31398]|uniref:oxidoreductase n=1 Tax=Nocardioides sp. CFH 31398 TaxID=2919579 RepID=UPI001F06FC1B|nr:oxidoreductase [Nocardioides sp. CFH 31398]MCH1868021.1 oxidoreductase [Nocardioides sp. CFH 31398]